MPRTQVVEGISLKTTVFLLPAIFGFIYLIYLALPYLRRVYRYLFGAGSSSMEVGDRRIYRQENCAICLQPIDLMVSGTCGHTFCAKCLFSLYEVERTKILCPSCRQPITTILKAFESHEPPTAGEALYTNRIKQYNYLYNDDRGILRCLIQLPVLWNHIKNALTNPRFFSYLIRNFGRYRAIFFLIIYILSPLDILPESFVGLVGLLDDILIALIVLALVSQAVMAFIRNQA